MVTRTSGLYTGFEAYQDFGHPYWLQAPLPAYEFSKDRERIADQGRQCRSREGQAMNGLISRLIYPGARRSVDVGQVERTLQPGEELVWQETTRDERIGLIIRPPADKKRWIVFFYGNGMTVAGTGAVRRWLGSTGYGVVCVEYAGFGVSSGSSPSEYGCYRSADAAITYLQRQASVTLDHVTLIGWSLGSAVAIDLASRRDVRAQVLLSPLTSLLACAIDLARIGKTSFAIGPFDALSRASSVDCPTLIISGSEDALTRPWMANELIKTMGGHARLVSLAGVGHNDMLSSGERLWDVVKDFLNSLEKTR